MTFSPLVNDLLRAVADHLWQSTLVALLGIVLAVACRRARASVRYGIWLGASLKFLLPAALLVSLGQQVSWRTVEVVPFGGPPLVLEAVADPFALGTFASTPAARASDARAVRALVPLILVAIWALGTLGLLGRWARQWARIRAARRHAVPQRDSRELARVAAAALRIGARPVPVLLSDAPIEPGIFGIVRPVLLWPRGIAARLSDAEIDAILLHEMCHVRRRDNLTAAVHMTVQAIFWFHPLVWWMGARLVDERERACDEAVIGAGKDREIYAEGILKTCKFFVESPLACVAGVTGSELKQRIEQIMRHDPRPPLAIWRRAALSIAGVLAFTTPVVVGALNPPPQTRGLPAPATLPAFDEVSIRPNTTAGRGGRGGGGMQPGRYVAQNLTLHNILRRAYGSTRPAVGNTADLFEAQVVGGPAWVTEDRFDIVAVAGSATPPDRMRLMLQRMLAERFKLAAHWETRELPVYVLRPARADGRPGSGLTPISPEACEKLRPSGPMVAPQPGVPAPPPPCGAIQFGPGQLLATGVPIDWLAASLTNVPVVTGIDRMVLDRSGLTGNFGFNLKFAPATASNPDPERPHLITALEEQLGLKLEAAQEPVEVLVIDSAARPDPN